MKAEHRKALETNTLAQEITKVVDTFKQGPSRSSMYWLGGIALGVVALLTFWYMWRSSERAASERWRELDGIVFPEQLASYLDKSGVSDTQQGRLARFKDARYKLTQGLRDLGTNPGLARENIEAGTKLYEELLKGVARIPLLHQEALWGAAKGNETLNNLDEAKQYYTKLVDDHPVSALGKDAKKQLDRLNSPEGKRDANELSKAFAPPQR
jgi:hypothetical protein